MNQTECITDLPTLSELAIPAGIKLIGEKMTNQTGGGKAIGIMDNPILVNWLNKQKIIDLQPTTLIPLGIILDSYEQYSCNLKIGKSSKIDDRVIEMIYSQDLKTYMRQNNLRKIDLSTKMPFAMIMGPDVFKQLLPK